MFTATVDTADQMFLLPPPVELLDGTELIKKLLADQPRDLQELIVGDELVHDLSLHPSGLMEAEVGADETPFWVRRCCSPGEQVKEDVPG